MTRTPVQPADLIPAIVTALNGTTVNGGTISAKANGQSVAITVHSDAVNTYAKTFDLFLH